MAEYLYGDKDIAVYLDATVMGGEGTIVGVRVRFAPEPSAIERSVYPPKNEWDIKDAKRAKELGLEVTEPAPVYPWQGPFMDLARFKEIVTDLWEDREFRFSLGWGVSPAEFLEELRECGGGVVEKDGVTTIRAWVGPGIKVETIIGYMSSDSPWESRSDEEVVKKIPALVQALCEEIAEVGRKNWIRIREGQASREKARLAKKFGVEGG